MRSAPPTGSGPPVATLIRLSERAHIRVNDLQASLLTAAVTDCTDKRNE
jgi:hypothetical protein